MAFDLDIWMVVYIDYIWVKFKLNVKVYGHRR